MQISFDRLTLIYFYRFALVFTDHCKSMKGLLCFSKKQSIIFFCCCSLITNIYREKYALTKTPLFILPVALALRMNDYTWSTQYFLISSRSTNLQTISTFLNFLFFGIEAKNKHGVLFRHIPLSYGMDRRKSHTSLFSLRSTPHSLRNDS